MSHKDSRSSSGSGSDGGTAPRAQAGLDPPKVKSSIADQSGSTADQSGNRGTVVLLLLAFLAVTTTIQATAKLWSWKGSPTSTMGGHGPAEVGRKLAEQHLVSTITELHDKVSYDGKTTMPNGNTTALSAGEYKCSDGTCAARSSMLATEGLYGTIRCLNDDASCVLDGESSRRGIKVEGTGSGKLTIRAIRFYKGEHTMGGGVYIYNGAKVDVTLCVFDSCEANSMYHGGGGVFVYSHDTVVSIYATAFTGNSAASGKGDDVFNEDGAFVVQHACPSPYEAQLPTRGEYQGDARHLHYRRYSHSKKFCKYRFVSLRFARH